jgi:hypothetical protein
MRAESTRKLLGNLFELQDLGAQDLKGIAEPVWAWALRTSSVESRFEAFKYADQEICDRLGHLQPSCCNCSTDRNDRRIGKAQSISKNGDRYGDAGTDHGGRDKGDEPKSRKLSGDASVL